MAWTYSDWVTLTGTARVTRLRQHVREVSDSIGREVSADGKSVSSNATQAYLDKLMVRLDNEERRPGVNGSIAGGVSLADFGGEQRRPYPPQ